MRNKNPLWLSVLLLVAVLALLVFADPFAVLDLDGPNPGLRASAPRN